MRKYTFRLSIIVFCFVLSFFTVFAASTTTNKSGSVIYKSNTYEVNANAVWEYETGKYLGSGSFTITQKPKDKFSTKYDVIFNSRTGVGTYTGNQYYQPKITHINIFGDISYEYGSIIHIQYPSPGAH